MLLNIVIQTVINAVALWVAAWAIPGITLGEGKDTGETLLTLLGVAVIFGVVNLIIKPIVKLLSIPFIILTLGLFIFIVNALMLQLTSWLAGVFDLSFHVESFFWDAILGALIITFVELILGFVKPD